MNQKNYEGGCHCKNIRFQFKADSIVSGLRCNCSICKRKGAMLSNFTLAPESLKIEDPDLFLTSYQFGTKVAIHYFCTKCGISPFVQTRLNPGDYRINLGCIDNIDLLQIIEKHYDGKLL